MAKKSKSLLPKKIAGLKVPKAVRKGQFGEMLASPTGQKLLAQAILAVGAVASAKKIKNSPKARGAMADTADKLHDTAVTAKDTVSDAGGVLAYALGEAVRSFTDALHSYGGRHDDDAPGDGGADDSKKKPISYEAGPL